MGDPIDEQAGHVANPEPAETIPAEKGTAWSRAGGLTRFIVIVPVMGLLVSAVALVVVGAIDTFKIIAEALRGGVYTKEIVVSFIELADVFLLAVVIYIIALGLYELFIDSNLQLPAWLRFNSLDDLKYQLVGVVIVVLGVLFLGRSIQATDSWELFLQGAGTALMIAALSLFKKSGH